jgi:hypothetical protein
MDPNQSNGQQATVQDELNSTRTGTAGLAGFGALSVTDVVNGMEAGGVSPTSQPKLLTIISSHRSKEPLSEAFQAPRGRCSNSKS